MSFTPEQNQALQAPLNGGKVKTRKQAGRELSYIEGWWAISEANRIFGFDGWTRETIDLKCVADSPRKVGKGTYERDGWGVTYIARVRVMVGDIIREGCGTGHGIDADQGQAHESALKEAETDAMKRALMTFGNPFGLALYDKEQNNVSHGDEANPEPKAEDSDVLEGAKNWVAVQKDAILACNDIESLSGWLKKKASRDKYDGDWIRPAPGSDLDRLLKRKELQPLFADLKNYYMEKLRTI